MKKIINVQATMTATVLTSAIVKRVHAATKDYAVLETKVKDADGRVVKLSHFYTVEHADWALAKAKRIVAGAAIEFDVSRIDIETVGNCVYTNYCGYIRG